MSERLKILTNGILKENPVLVLAIGLCPALAVSNTAFNGLGMGLAATFVLISSNFLISSMRSIIPSNIRIPIFIIIISSFVTMIDYLMQAYMPGLYENLGIFVPLIVVNCIILGRAEAFASKKSVGRSLLDGLGMGLGFTLALFVIGTIREIVGMGTLDFSNIGLFKFDLKQYFPDLKPVLIMVLPPGAFLTFGFLMALRKRLMDK